MSDFADHRVQSDSPLSRKLLSTAFALLSIAASFFGGAATAQEKFPSRPIEIVVPAPAGGSLDTAFRILEPSLSARLGVPLVILNRPGASGTIGMASVIRARADGYTVAATSSSTLTVVNLTAKNLTYSLRDFISVGNYATDAGAIVVAADAPWKTLEDFVSDARTNPGKITYGSYGIGSLSALNIKAIELAFGLDLVNVPFPGAPQANLAVVGKHIDMSASPLSAVAAFLRDGKARALVTTADTRLPSFPDVPTMTEKNVHQGNLKLLLGLYVVAGTPDARVSVLAKALEDTVTEPAVVQALVRAGMIVEFSDCRRARWLLEREYDDVMELGRKMNLSK
jgi:tripartite-type tricarboxylate transporter receptor subunit TctC